MLLDADEIKRSNDEHKAWLLFVQEWRLLNPGADINEAKYDPMIRAIQAWGELLVDIRVHQSDVQKGIARADALANYLQAAEKRHPDAE